MKTENKPKARKKSKKQKPGFKLYPLKKDTVIGTTLRKKGDKISLNIDGYKFYKRLNIV